jgi:hypothetical protein
MTTPGMRASRRLSLLVCSVAVFVVMLDGTVVNVALPSWRDSSAPVCRACSG